jgi:hypothetical protein
MPSLLPRAGVSVQIVMERVSPLSFMAFCAPAAASPAIARTPPVFTPTRDYGPVWTGFDVGAAFGSGGMVNQIKTRGSPIKTADAEE